MKCSRRHTKYQPTDIEFVCPRCGAEAGEFYIESIIDDDFTECEFLHADDVLVCEKCGYIISGARFSNALQRHHNLVTCPHCKGMGLVKSTHNTD